MTAISDAIFEDVITSEDIGIFQNISNVISDTVNTLMGKEAASSLNVRNAENAFEFVKNFNTKVLKGGSRPVITGIKMKN